MTSRIATAERQTRSRLARFGVLFTAFGALVLAYAFAVLLARYWRFYHLGAPGSGFFLLAIVFPISALSVLGVAEAARRLLVRRGRAERSARIAGVLAGGLLLAALFAAEVASTTSERSGEGDGAGDLAPFFRSLVKI